MTHDEELIELVVCGSLNVDFTSYILNSRLPKLGETITGSLFERNYGGKGANQCVQASRLGIHTKMLGSIGDDIFGKDYKNHLESEYVETSDLQCVSSCATGTAQILAPTKGDNVIVVVPGANSKSNDLYIDESIAVLEKLHIHTESPLRVLN